MCKAKNIVRDMTGKNDIYDIYGYEYAHENTLGNVKGMERRLLLDKLKFWK